MWAEAGEVGRRSTKKGSGTWFLSLYEQGCIEGTPMSLRWRRSPCGLSGPLKTFLSSR